MSADPLSIDNLAYAEEAYASWRRDPSSVSEDWRRLFDGEAPHAGPEPAAAPRTADLAAIHEKLNRIVRAFRLLGHVEADLDPLGHPVVRRPELTPEHYGLGDDVLDVPVTNVPVTGCESTTLRKLLVRLRNTYCRSIGVQYMHIDDMPIRHWLEVRMEGTENRITLSKEQQTRIFSKLTDAELFEQFIHKKFPGMKRFSLEGAETLIPLMDCAIEEAGAHGVAEVVIGMAHRGRLNVLANVMEKSPRQIFREFMDTNPDQFIGRGDVKYHQGYSADRTTFAGHRVHLSLCFNPSHLECVSPVVVGRVRAKQDNLRDAHRRAVMGLVVHGDAAFAGQGVVQELLNMSELPGYRTGGTIHIVLNNQIGFTTPPEAARSTRYATEVARMLQIPIFHVNGEDPEGVVRVVRLALEFRRQFAKDVVIDMYCYRRHGHNEGDEPMFTQPLMYRKIQARKSVREGYLERLLGMGGLTLAEAAHIEQERLGAAGPGGPAGGFDGRGEEGRDLTKTGAFRIIEQTEARLERELEQSRGHDAAAADAGLGIWRPYTGGPDALCPDVDTGVPDEALLGLMVALTELPDGFHLHGKVERLLQGRLRMARGERDFDWGAAEALAMASLLVAGRPIRLAGQDVGRGTFSHRHAVLHDQEDGHTYIPLDHLSEDQAALSIFDSPLSELAVLGFEYGYSLDMPNGLTIWEAQFGDFANMAQAIIDQFISSCEDKWLRLSGITMLLPHGFEGQGPEHSSARLERFLQLCAEDNIQVVNPTTPAQFFHCLRRQVLRPYRKPLVVMAPKSLLRHPEAVSPRADLTQGRFRRVLPDPAVPEAVAPDRVRQILMCSGKIWYDLAAARRERRRDDVAIVRLEQLYPVADAEIAQALAPFPAAAPVVWVQEEPLNMGAAWFVGERLQGGALRGRTLLRVGREESASPATGSAASHRIEQERLIEEAFASHD